MFRVPERFRVQVPGYPPGDSQNGCFVVSLGDKCVESLRQEFGGRIVG